MNHNFHTQCSLGDLESVMDTVTRNPASLNCLVQGWSPLMFASYHGREDVVVYLIQKGADRLIVNPQGQTALLIAASNNDLTILTAVYDERIVNAEDSNGWTPLFHAVNVGFEPGIHYLLQNKADINHRDEKGWTTLMLACSNGAQNIIQLLVKYNADKALVNSNKESAEDIVIKYSSGGNLYRREQRRSKKHHHHLHHRHRKGRSSLVTLLQLQTPYSDALAKLLHELSLDKYYALFRSKQIDLNAFSQMNEEDLKNIGIALLGPRRKMYLAICKLKGEEYKRDI